MKQRKRTSCLRVEELEPRIALSLYYVAPTGSDQANGSSGAPWRTLQHAAGIVRAGDTVTVRAGNYAGFNLTTDGTAAGRITFRADPNVVVNSRNSETPDGINLEGADYITIQGFQVVGLPRAGIRSVENTHVVIRHNRADQNGRWGIFTGFSADLTIENNVTSRSGTEHGIYVSNSGDRPVVRNNVVWGNYGSGIQLNADASQGGDGIISGALVERNTIYDNGRGGGAAINLDGVQTGRIQSNLLHNNHASGIALFQIDGATGSLNNIVVNNTVVQPADGRWALLVVSGSTGNIVRNNILYNHHASRGSISISRDSLSGLKSDFNILMDRFTLDDGDTVLTFAQWRSSTGQDKHSFLSTPAALFVNPGAADYHLSARSPAVDTGTGWAAAPTDLEGRPRPRACAFVDIGAYESSWSKSNPPLRPVCPLTYSATSSIWSVRNTLTTGPAHMAFAYGTPGDIPIIGDWNGDGIATPGVFRNGQFLLRNSLGSGPAQIVFAFGAAGDTPVVGDWNGDGIDTVGVRRGTTWYLRNSNSAGAANVTFAFGASSDIPVTGDWNGDGVDSVGLWRSGTWLLKNQNAAGPADLQVTFGAASDKPVVGDWDGDGDDTIGVYRSGQWRLSNRNVSTSAVDILFSFGLASDVPLAGAVR